MQVAAICGSLRRESRNQILLETVRERAVAFGLEIVQVPIADFGLYNQDLEAEWPEAVVEAKRVIQSCTCLLLVTPEHNYSIPGVMKNAIDWLSRPFDNPTLYHRPVAFMGASNGYMGTERAQLALRQMWHAFDAPVFSAASLTVPFVQRKIENGRITDEDTLKRIDKYLAAFAEWAGRYA